MVEGTEWVPAAESEWARESFASHRAKSFSTMMLIQIDVFFSAAPAMLGLGGGLLLGSALF